MKFPVIFISLILFGTLGATETVQILHTTAKARVSLQTHTASYPRFDLCGTVTLSSLKFLPLTFVLEDSSGGILIDNETPALVKPGDVVHVSGSVELGKKSKRRLAAKKLEIIQHGPQPEPVPTTVADILAGRNDFQLVSVRGTVIDEFQDDIDLNYHHLLLATGKETIIISIPEKGLQGSRRFLNSEISAVGLCRPDMGYYRTFHGHGLTSKLDGITIRKPAPDDPFDVPDIAALRTKRAAEIAVLGRHKAVGRVIATWEENRLLLRTSDGETVRVILTEKRQSPKVGDIVEGYDIIEIKRTLK